MLSGIVVGTDVPDETIISTGESNRWKQLTCDEYSLALQVWDDWRGPGRHGRRLPGM